MQMCVVAENQHSRDLAPPIGPVLTKSHPALQGQLPALPSSYLPFISEKLQGPYSKALLQVTTLHCMLATAQLPSILITGLGEAVLKCQPR